NQHCFSMLHPSTLTPNKLQLSSNSAHSRGLKCVLTALFAFDVGHEATTSLAAIFAFLLSIQQYVS
ncbi:MAG: hypothetical protein ACM34E_11710, partial [Acidobacteriota bacterium]